MNNEKNFKPKEKRFKRKKLKGKKSVEISQFYGRDAIGKSYKKYLTKWRYWLRQWGTPEDAIEDIIQETLVALWRARDKRIRYPEAYVRTILHRKRADYLRKWKNHPDLNNLYLRISEINAKIKNTGETIKRIKSAQGKMERLAKLNEEISKLLKEKDEIGEQINEMNRKLREAKIKAQDSDKGGPSSYPDSILEANQEEDKEERFKKALMENFPEFENRELDMIFEALFDGVKMPQLADKYDMTIQRARTIYNRFIRHARRKIRTKRKFYEMYK